MRSAWLTVDGRRAHVRRSDAHPPGAPLVLLLHGVGVSHRHLAPLADALEPHLEVLVPDLPGHGRTAPPPDPLGPAACAAFVERLLEAVRARPACVVGNSLGCQVAVELAVRRPDLVPGAVLVGPTGDPRVPSLRRWIVRLARDSVREPAGLNAVVVTDYVRAGPVRTVRTFRRALCEPLAGQPPGVRAPVLVLRGSRDPICPAGWAARLAASFPHGRAATVAGAAHAAHWSAPQAVAAHVRAALAA